MTYALVCLVGDAPTQLAADFARWIAIRRPPHQAWFESHPTATDVQKAVATTKQLLAFGHNGRLNDEHSMRSHSGSNIWLRGPELGAHFAGARIYLWACETMGAGSTRSAEVSSLGDEAIAAGAAVVAGHSVTLSADFSQIGGRFSEHFRAALGAMIFSFLDGLDDPAELKLRAREELPMEIDLQLPAEGLDWFRASQWLFDRIDNLHIAKRSNRP